MVVQKRSDLGDEDDLELLSFLQSVLEELVGYL